MPKLDRACTILNAFFEAFERKKGDIFLFTHESYADFIKQQIQELVMPNAELQCVETAREPHDDVDWGGSSGDDLDENVTETAPGQLWYESCMQACLHETKTTQIGDPSSGKSVDTGPPTCTELQLPHSGMGRLFIAGYTPSDKNQLTHAIQIMKALDIRLVVNCMSKMKEMVFEQHGVEEHLQSNKCLCFYWGISNSMIPDESALQAIASILLAGKNVLMHCTTGNNASAIQACKILMCVYGCGWEAAANLVVNRRQSACIRSIDSGLLELQRKLYDDDGSIKLNERISFWKELSARTTAPDC